MTKIALRLLLAVTLVLPGAVLGAPPAAAQQTPSGDSAVTKSGTGEFANLKVTVSQTKSLINQTVKVSWTGFEPPPTVGNPVNFLQIMQCWGDDLVAGPDRTQCQFGKSGETTGPIAQRALRIRPPLVDPAETYGPADPTGIQNSHVPFWPVGGTQPTVSTVDTDNEFFDAQITNEIPLARSRGNGAGDVDFEIQTVRQAAGLGCGAPVDVNGTTTGRPCWLVIVPRGSTEVDGSSVVGNRLGFQSSPLSKTNWDKRIVIPLEFLPQGRACPLGAPERRLTGHELVVDAVSRWQPALCGNGGALYSFTQLSDDLVRSQLLEASDPGLALISNPAPPDQQRPDGPLVYAPIAVSGLAFAFTIVKDPPNLFADDDPRREVAGQPFTEMKLTPRLVAKLLTQSYKGAIIGFGANDVQSNTPAQVAMRQNPWGLTADPDFLEFNPGYKNLLVPDLHVDALVQLGTSDLTGLLWDWVLADQEARDFIDGTKDPHGMVVNPANKGLRPPLFTYPRNDQSCTPTSAGDAAGTVFGFYCTGDAHQFANDMHEAGRGASRGDSLGRDAGGTVTPDRRIVFPKKPRQGVERRALIAVVDAATADRYQLRTAMLRNRAGAFVAPDEAGLRAGLDAMKPSAVQGVLQPDPATTNSAAYPLTSMSNAATAPLALTKEAGREYAAFIRYAVGAGQQPGQLPGQLPPGYLPLPEPLRQQALGVATIIEILAGTSLGGDPPPQGPAAVGPPGTGPGPAGNRTATSGDGSGSTGGTGTGSTSGTGQATVTPPGSAPVGAPAGTPGGATPRPATAVVRRTPALATPTVGALLATLLIGGGLAAALALVSRRLGIPRKEIGGGDAGDRIVTRRYLSWLTARLTRFAQRR